jgi:hypothetical protein
MCAHTQHAVPELELQEDQNSEHDADQPASTDSDYLYEITDFPILLMDTSNGTCAHTCVHVLVTLMVCHIGAVLEHFHCFVRPQKIEWSKVEYYVNRKYGQMGLAQVLQGVIVVVC